jgi:hypothetical protein
MATVDVVMSGDIPSPVLGGNRRSINRKLRRMFDGAKRPTKRSKLLDRLPPSYDSRNQTSEQYYVKTVTTTVNGETRERNARLVLREPSRRIPESEKPSKVVKSKVS